MNLNDKKDFLIEASDYIYSLVNGIKQSGIMLTREELREWIIKEEKDYNNHFEDFQREWIIEAVFEEL